MDNPTPSFDSAMPFEVIANKLRRDGPGTYGITGPAGVGKTFTANKLAETVGHAIYSADYRFIGNSEEREMLLLRKQTRSVQDYKDAANQFNWWDWGSILSDLEDLQSGNSVRIAKPYDRATGNYGADLALPATDRLIYEGAIFGPPYIVNRLKQIFFLWVDPSVRFQRLMEKDRGRRSFNEMLARFLITEYSETLYYRNLFKWAEDKIIVVDAVTGLPRGWPELPSDVFVPLRVPAPSAA